MVLSILSSNKIFTEKSKIIVLKIVIINIYIIQIIMKKEKGNTVVLCT